MVAQWILQAWNEIDPNLIRKAFKCCGISNSRDGTEDSLIFDYDRLGQRTNSRNHVYVQDEFENSSESSGSNIAEGSNTNIVEGSNTNTGEGPNTSTSESSNTNISEGL